MVQRGRQDYKRTAAIKYNLAICPFFPSVSVSVGVKERGKGLAREREREKKSSSFTYQVMLSIITP